MQNKEMSETFAEKRAYMELAVSNIKTASSKNVQSPEFSQTISHIAMPASSCMAGMC